MDKEWLEKYADKFKALGHPIRLQIVIGLLNNECNVTKICEGLKIPQGTTSQHLIALKNKGILESKREGNTVCYYVVDEAIKEIINTLVSVTGVDPTCK
ncbi:metalloregulator ArsR/SmtB family transcription factor [Deferribacter thermophilus]|uniref:ArsR/SmtB family transcription factor n=1 Tax=Deferribacter thermophilus TaxID=53573 RepID=UPI003C28B450